jgi:hypothetical protein
MLMKIVLILFLYTISIISFSQNNVVWGDFEKSKGRLTDLLPMEGSDFYTLRYNGGALLGSYFLGNHSTFKLTKYGKIQSKIGNSMANVISISILDKEPVVFLSNSVDGQKVFYAQKYGLDCQPFGQAVELARFNSKGWKSKGKYNVLVSQNKQFLCVEFEIPASKGDNERFAYKVYSSDLTLISQGEYELPYTVREADIANRYISNTGDYFLSVKKFDISEKRLIRDYSSLEKIILIHVTPNGIQEFDMEIDGKRVFDMSFSSDNNRIMTFTGLYGQGTRKDYGIKGVFYFRLNFDKKEVLDFGFEPFKKDFLTEGWSEKAKERAEKNEEKGKGTPNLYNYDIREIITTADGSIVGMLEQYYVRVYTSTDSRGQVRTTYYYYYNDIIAYKIEPNGVFSWVKKIQKNQVSTNDNGYFSSFARYATGDKLFIYFNDNLKNYDELGNFLNSDRIYNSSYRKKTNTVAKVEIDLTTGKIDRTTYFDRKETSAYAVPKLWKVDYNRKEMLMYLSFGNKEKIGLLDFN